MSLNQNEVQGMFDEASTVGYQHYHWVPPKWEAIQTTLKFEDNSDQSWNQMFDGTTFNKQKVPELLKRAENEVANDETEEPGASGMGKWPKAFADTTHVDPVKRNPNNPNDPFGDGTMDQIEKILKDKGEVKMESFIRELKQVVGPNSAGMKRLNLMFEWVILRATICLNDMNRALDNGVLGDIDTSGNQRDKYLAARENYLLFLKDLDDHEPGVKSGRLDPSLKNKLKGNEKGRKSGYGRSIKWFYIAPVIEGGRVRAARVIVHWNPHSSSLGVAINH